MFSLVSLTAQEKTNTGISTKQEIPKKSTMGQLINRNWFEVHLQHLWTNRSYYVKYTQNKRIVVELTDSATIKKETQYDYYLSSGKDKRFKQEKTGKSFNGSYIVYRDTANGKEKLHYIKINFLRGSILKQYNANNKNAKEQMMMCGIDINQGRKFLDIETTMKLLCNKDWINIENDERAWYFEEDMLISYTNNYRNKFMRNYYLSDKIETDFNRDKTAITKSGKYITVKGTPWIEENGQLSKYKGKEEKAFQYRIIHLSEDKLIVRSIQPRGSRIPERELEFECY